MGTVSYRLLTTSLTPWVSVWPPPTSRSTMSRDLLLRWLLLLLKLQLPSLRLPAPLSQPTTPARFSPPKFSTPTCHMPRTTPTLPLLPQWYRPLLVGRSFLSTGLLLLPMSLLLPLPSTTLRMTSASTALVTMTAAR